jgi:peptidoglycan/xylan/chitin deacetylase (PgdA/CDA1 family)
MRTPSPFALLARLAVLVALTVGWVAQPGTVAAADAPGACGSATTSSAKNAWLADTISTSGDVDWFRFSTTTASRTLVTLGHLPADYDLYVYSGCSTLVASSTRSGVQYDEVYAYLAAGTYSVKVVGYAGAHSTTAYSVRFRPIAWGVQVLSSTTWTDSAGYLHVAGEVLNNTAEYRRWIEVDGTLLDATGRAVGSAVGYPDVPTIAPWSRSPFELTTRRPTGYARTTLKVCTPSPTGGCLSGQTTSAPVAGLSITAAPTYLDASGRRHYAGTIRNGGTSTAYLVRSVVTLYDVYGNVAGFAGSATSPSTIAVAASGSFDTWGTGTSSPNRIGYAVQASRVGCAATPRYAGGQENVVPPIARTSASGRIALTFDMGGRMDPAVRILNTLVANRVCATIFPTGAISRTSQGQAALAVIRAHPDLFELGNHTMHHCDLVHGGGGSPGAADATYCASLAPSPTQAEVQKELTDADSWIRSYSGMATKGFWRAPYGTSNLTVRTWAAQAGWTKQIGWNIDTIDWRPISDGGPNARAITLKVVNNATSGSIVLMHLGGYETPDALQAMIDGLRSRGFVLTTVSDLAQ